MSVKFRSASRARLCAMTIETIVALCSRSPRTPIALVDDPAGFIVATSNSGRCCTAVFASCDLVGKSTTEKRKRCLVISPSLFISRNSGSRMAANFAPLTRLHGADIAGAGLGLAICKRMIESEGRHIWVESVPGQGSTFHFTLQAIAPAD